jgi:hypothetical protein
MNKILFHNRLYDAIDNIIVKYAGEYLTPHELITRILKYSEPEDIDKYLNYRPPGFDQKYKELAGEEKPHPNFIEKSIAKSDEKIILSYIPYLNEKNKILFVNTFLFSPLPVINENLQTKMINDLIKEVKFNDQTERMALMLPPHWLNLVLNNPTHTIYQRIDKESDYYLNVVIKRYLEENHSRYYLESFETLINHPKTPIEYLLKLENSIRRVSNNSFFSQEVVEEKILTPLNKFISEKEKAKIYDSLNVVPHEINNIVKKVKL